MALVGFAHPAIVSFLVFAPLTWFESAKLTAKDGAAQDMLGSSVAIDGAGRSSACAGSRTTP